MSGKQATIDEKANTPVPGAESAAENKTAEQAKVEVLEVKTPEWVQAILDSNAKLIESNQSVVDAITQFKEASYDFAKELGEGLRAQLAPSEFNQSVMEKQLDLDESYVVAEGKSFRDPKNFTKEYVAGDDVDHLDPEVLTRLLNQGLIEEA